MKVSEYLSFIKAGYSKKEINEIVKNEMEENSNPEVKKEVEEKAEEKQDFEKLYKESLERITTLENENKEAIEKLQKVNTSKDLSGDYKSFDDKIKESLDKLF